MTKNELLERITSSELTEWQAYYNIEPFGEQRADLRSAMICCVMANAWSSGKGQQFKIKDFMPIFEPSKPQDSKTMVSIAKAFASAMRNSKRKK